MSEAEERAAVVAEALTWVGTPFHHGQRVKGAGADCGQFPLAVFDAVGLIKSYHPAEYPPDFHIHSDDEMYLRHLEKFTAKVDSPRPGDIAMFRFGRVISHAAIVVNWPEVVHAYVEARMVTPDDAEVNCELAKRFVGWWSYWAKEKP